MRASVNWTGSGNGRAIRILAWHAIAGRRGSLRRSVSLCLGLWAVGLTCGESTAPPDPPVATFVQAVSATQQEAITGSAVGEAPGVIVRDQYNEVMAGVTVSFTISVGAGSVTPGIVSTGADGIARATSWTLGSSPGNNVLIASVAGLTPVSFAANGVHPPAIATSAEAASAVSQEAAAGSAVPDPPAVLVRDQRGDPMSGVNVEFAVTAGGGAIMPATVVTGADGIARVAAWTLGGAAGENAATATVGALPAVSFAATATAAPAVATSIFPASALTQTAIVESAVADPPAVLVHDQYGEPLSGVTVTFAVTAGGGNVQPATQITGADGIARVTSWTLGPGTGAHSVAATVTGFDALVFNASGVLPPTQTPTTVEAVSLTAQQGLVGAAVADPPAVLVRDEEGTPIAGVSVAFSVTAGDGTVVPGQQLTDVDGVARATSWTLGGSAGLNTVTATVAGLPPVVFDATGTAPQQVPSSITALTVQSQQTPVGTAVAVPPSVIVRDQFAAPMAGVTVSFTVTTGGGAVTPGEVVTGSDGVATVTNWTVGTVQGLNTLIATTGSLQAVVFNANAFVPAAPSVVTAVSLTSQTGPAGGEVADPPGVLVRDQNNNPLPGITVTFAVTGGGGAVTPTSQVTSPLGIARVTGWTLGSVPGENVVTASVSDLPPVTFVATGALVAASVEAISAQAQQAPVGTTVPEAPAVLVRDQFGQPLPGVTVTFAITAGGGSASPLVQNTAADGTARLSSWTLGPVAGPNAVTATAGSLPPVTFTAGGVQPDAVPTSIQATTPLSQEGPAGAPVDDPPGVLVRDQNNAPMAGVTVTFAITAGGGSVVPGPVVTGTDGVAQLTSWVLGSAPGTNSVTAAVPGLAPITFSATGVLVASSIEAVASTAQQGLTSTPVAEPPGVMVRDQSGAPLPGVQVSFEITSGGGSRSPASVTTGATGIAQLSNWTLGSSPGSNTLAASVSGLPAVTFTAEGVAVATSVQASTPTMQQGAAGAAVNNAPGVLVRDHLNNPMQGVTVNFAVTAGGGSINPSAVVTGADGIAQLTSWTLGNAPGSNTVTATVAGLTPVTFNALGNLVATTIEATTATEQQAPAGSAVAQAPGVMVRDQFGAGMSGVSVGFAVTAGGGSISPATVVTGTGGMAQLTSWTLGSDAGTNTVTATAGSLAPITFNATALLAGAPTTMVAVTATSQMAPGGSAVAQPPGVLLGDANSLPVPGVTVNFAVTSGNGTVTPTSVVTGSDGIAQVTSWVIGNAPQPQTVTASASGVTSVVFTATRSEGAPTATSIEAITNQSQQAPTGSTVPVAPAVRVRDQVDVPMSGVSVAFTITAGGGSRTPSSVITDANGEAQLTSWTLGPAVGTNTLTAAASGLAQTVTFTAEGVAVATSVQASTPTMQQGAAGAAVNNAPGVLVRDHLNNPMQGVTVNFAVTAGGGSINPSAVVTGADGIAQLTSWTLGNAPGSNTVTATVAGLTPVTFNALGNLVATTIEATTATEQQAPAGSAVAQAPGVMVRDQFGAGMSGVSVGFAVTAGGGSISPATVVTGAGGTAQLTSWTLGSDAGTNTVTATAGSLAPITFNATGSLIAASVQANSATTQQAPAGQPVSAPPDSHRP
jgi:adhesin/invasin